MADACAQGSNRRRRGAATSALPGRLWTVRGRSAAANNDQRRPLKRPGLLPVPAETQVTKIPGKTQGKKKDGGGCCAVVEYSNHRARSRPPIASAGRPTSPHDPDDLPAESSE